ncbi:sigma-70 family RNA polymerase sigma factor [Streptomyces sp. SAJ15]|uniref:sigma-70 family RNA polymerase sigma factor n=1 Tax=Streptomyces sp. SAJ15 TaxID=2011095 RepID=UPI0011847CD9|nr:sigma-70 family RNA polymerase sigma factor [Streptomyces sp. SAJ15]TVL90381.1 hypothetical protein CD790_23120 [Streptomyces sp. SAJ15]
MHRDNAYTPDLVTAAQAGDQRARERLVAEYLPLVYNIVGRALDGHADVDDVVQETMFRALDGLAGLREPSSFRSWLVAIAMNQIRRRWTDRQQAAAASLDKVTETPDPTGDFVDLTILRLGLSGQRREVAEATRWLDDDDRDLLALWWQEAAGGLTRAELAVALGVTPQHTAVRVKRMKTQLEVGRVVVRALATEPRCAELASLIAPWDGRPQPVWRKRIARHARACVACSGHWSNLVPAEGLLVGMALVVPVTGLGFGFPPGLSDPTALAAQQTTLPSADLAGAPVPAGAPTHGGVPTHAGAATDGTPPAGPATDGVTPTGTTPDGIPPIGNATDGATPTGPATDGASSIGGTGATPTGATLDGAPADGSPAVHAASGGGRLKASAVVVGGGVIGGVLLALLWPVNERPAERAPVAAPQHSATPARTTAAKPSTSPRPSKTATPKPKPTPAATKAKPKPRPTPTPKPTPASAEERLTSLVNARRAQAGCGPLRIDPRLSEAARKHARDMVARGYFDHASPEGTQPDARISAAGYAWSSWAENLAQGSPEPAAAVEQWMDGSYHQENMLNCRYRDTGVAAVSGPDGTVWVQDLAGPA